MGILPEFIFLRCGQIASDTLCRGVRSYQVRIHPFHGNKLVHQHIIVIITDKRGILHIIPMIVFGYDAFQLLYFLFCLSDIHIRRVTSIKLTKLTIFSLKFAEIR